MSGPGNSQAFWTYWFLALGAILLIMFLATHWDDVIEFISGLFDCIGESSYEYRHPTAEERHRKKARRWRIAIPWIARRRMRREYSRSLRKAKRRSMDVVAETMATHQEMLEAMYGDAPSIFDVYQYVGEQPSHRQNSPQWRR